MRSPAAPIAMIALLCGLLLAPLPAAAHSSNEAIEARNKETILEFYRVVFEAQNVAAAKDYIAPGYIQHNPRVPGGLDGFVAFFSKLWKEPRPVAALLRNPPVLLMADGDLVTIVFRRMRPEPADPTKQYASYWFDTYRLDAAGKIVEHWDAATKEPPTP